eukprot:TRINITY_DN10611_c0_g2_i11.p1 TRINITY_DN10611_c0_g2~~TRINITY_DN10611_c0_g2_i11.p1  ORF type:complete len:254 (+),score=53.31 TRINITY_DN10611_c0_g2_i11:535-1296(+)
MGVAFTGVKGASGISPAASVYRNTKLSFNFGPNFVHLPKYCTSINYSLNDAQRKSLNELFEKYQAIGTKLSESGESGDLIKGGGVLQLGQDIGSKGDDDPVLLILAWKLRAEVVWEFSRDEFVTGFAIQGVYSMSDLKKKVVEWKNDIKNDKDQFRSFYNFIFEYLKDPKATALEKEEALMAWGMLNLTSIWKLWPKWEEFLKKSPTKSVPRDTWQMLLTFIDQIGENVSSYDPMDCWPIIIDEFCEYVNSKQ